MKAPLRPPTAGALARIERGDLAPFGVDATANAGSGVLEAYLDERGRRASHASWRGPAALGAVSGAVAAVAVVAAGLVLGVVVAFAWHVTLVAALARRLGAREAATASAGALAGGAAAAGLLFLPAGPAARPAAWLAATVGGALLGLGFAALVRRAWLVDSPLPWPATHGHVRLLALAETASVAAAGRARHALTLLATAVTGAIAFALARGAVPLPARIWDAGLGAVRLPAPVPGLGFAFSALAAGAGALLRRSAAWGIAAGSFAAWFGIVPLALLFAVPVDDAGASLRGLARTPGEAEAAARTAILAPLAAGALAGAGLVLVVRRMRAVGSALRAASQWTPDRTEARSWWAWPRAASVAALAAGGVLVVVAAVLAGAPIGGGVALGALTAALSVALAATAMHAASDGEDALLAPVAFGAAVLALAAASLAPGAGALAAGALLSAIAVAIAGIQGARAGSHAGARPYAQQSAALLAVVPAAAVGVLVAGFLVLDAGVALPAPPAHAFLAWADLAAGPLTLSLLGLGAAAGIGLAFAGGGTAFALGILLPFPLAVPLVLGAEARAWWDRRAAAQAREESWDEERRLLRFLDASLVAIGLVLGEALALAAGAAYRLL